MTQYYTHEVRVHPDARHVYLKEGWKVIGRDGRLLVLSKKMKRQRVDPYRVNYYI